MLTGRNHIPCSCQIPCSLRNRYLRSSIVGVALRGHPFRCDLEVTKPRGGAATECRPYKFELRACYADFSLHETFNFQRHAVSLRLPDKLSVDLENPQLHDFFYREIG